MDTSSIRSCEVQGFYVQFGSQYPMGGTFYTSGDGKITGNSKDEVGKADWTGSHDLETGEFKLIKQYKGAHSVNYNGKLTDNILNGTWDIGGWGNGEFQFIFPTEFLYGPSSEEPASPKWKGYYEYKGNSYPMEIFKFEIADDQSINITSKDEVGVANFTGNYIDQTAFLQKKYIGMHTIIYEGNFNADFTELNGTWRYDDPEDDTTGAFKFFKEQF